MTAPVVGHFEPISAFEKACNSGRFHHAWLIEGPEGIGKSIAVSHLAAMLLGAELSNTSDRCFAKDCDVTKRIEAGSHPDFRCVRKPISETGKQKQDIPVDEMRTLSHFFSLKPALGGRRVAVVDAVDELNPSGANALLKTLEEPPANSVLLLVYHKRSGLLPTIRSRCQRLIFKPLSDQTVKSILENDTEQDFEVSDDILTLADGSPGLAKKYIEGKTDELLNALKELLSTSWPELSIQKTNQVLRLMSASDVHFDFAIHFIEHWLNELSAMELTPGSLRRIGKSWQDIRLNAGKSAQLNLDLTERSAQCLGHLKALSEGFRTQNAI